MSLAPKLIFPKSLWMVPCFCRSPDGTWWYENLISASVLLCAGEELVITNNSLGAISCPWRGTTPIPFGDHTLVCESPPRMSDGWLSSRELPIEPAVVLKSWKENKTTLEGNDHHPFISCEAVKAGRGPSCSPATDSRFLGDSGFRSVSAGGAISWVSSAVVPRSSENYLFRSDIF